MPRYLFNVKSGGHTFPDHEGLSFPNAEAAQRHAAQHTCALVKVYSRDAFACEIEVLNEDGERVAIVPAGETISLDPLS